MAQIFLVLSTTHQFRLHHSRSAYHLVKRWALLKSGESTFSFSGPSTQSGSDSRLLSHPLRAAFPTEVQVSELLLCCLVSRSRMHPWGVRLRLEFNFILKCSSHRPGFEALGLSQACAFISAVTLALVSLRAQRTPSPVISPMAHLTRPAACGGPCYLSSAWKDRASLRWLAEAPCPHLGQRQGLS